MRSLSARAGRDDADVVAAGRGRVEERDAIGDDLAAASLERAHQDSIVHPGPVHVLEARHRHLGIPGNNQPASCVLYIVSRFGKYSEVDSALAWALPAPSPPIPHSVAPLSCLRSTPLPHCFCETNPFAASPLSARRFLAPPLSRCAHLSIIAPSLLRNELQNGQSAHRPGALRCHSAKQTHRTTDRIAPGICKTNFGQLLHPCQPTPTRRQLHAPVRNEPIPTSRPHRPALCKTNLGRPLLPCQPASTRHRSALVCQTNPSRPPATSPRSPAKRTSPLHPCQPAPARHRIRTPVRNEPIAIPGHIAPLSCKTNFGRALHPCQPVSTRRRFALVCETNPLQPASLRTPAKRTCQQNELQSGQSAAIHPDHPITASAGR